MALAEQQLAQSRPGSTTAAGIYSPGATETAIIKNIVVCNTTTSAAAFRIFVDDNGAVYDQSTALFYDISIAANETISIDVFWPMNDSTGNLAVRTDTISALTFTVFGAIITP